MWVGQAVKIEGLQSEVKYSKISINELTLNCVNCRQDSENSRGVYKCHLLRFLDDASVKSLAHPENFVAGMHCKIILAKDRDAVFNLQTLQCLVG